MSCRLVSRLCIQKVNSPKLPRAVWFCNPGVQFHHLLNLQRGSMPFREESLSQTRIGAGVLSAQSLLMIFKMSPGTSHRRGFMDCPLERGLLIANQPCEEMATSTPPHHKIKGACLLSQRWVCYSSRKWHCAESSAGSSLQKVHCRWMESFAAVSNPCGYKDNFHEFLCFENICREGCTRCPAVSHFRPLIHLSRERALTDRHMARTKDQSAQYFPGLALQCVKWGPFLLPSVLHGLWESTQTCKQTW